MSEREESDVRAKLEQAVREGNVEFTDAAEAGIRQLLTGESGCPHLKLDWHEVEDLVFSGRAFGHLDGALIEITDETGELRKLEAVWKREGKVTEI